MTIKKGPVPSLLSKKYSLSVAEHPSGPCVGKFSRFGASFRYRVRQFCGGPIEGFLGVINSRVFVFFKGDTGARMAYEKYRSKAASGLPGYARLARF